MKNIEKYYHVFVSSTFLDLKDERATLMQLLYTTNFVPRGMELFPNGRPDVWELIKEIIDQCDLYILIVAGRYGSISSEDGKSFTEREFDYAVEKGKTILVYQHKEPDLHNPEMSKDDGPNGKEKLRDFRGKIKNRTIKFWGNTQELERHLAVDLMSLNNQLEGGWIRQRSGMARRFSDELGWLEKKFESKEVMKLTELFQNALRDFKFGRTKDRVHTLGDLIPWLSDQEWNVLTKLASAQAEIRGMLKDPDKKPLTKPLYDSIVDMVTHYEQQIKNFENRIFEVDGKLFDEVSKHFVLAVKKEFLALSNNDFVFWDADTSQDYYDHNLELIRNGVVIKRIFTIPSGKLNDPSIHNSVLRQIKDKIQVGIITTERLSSLITGVSEQDFAIHDSFAVSFFRPYKHRIYRVITQDRDIKHYRELHYNISNNSQDVPDKTGENRKWFQNEEEFDLWIKKINAMNR